MSSCSSGLCSCSEIDFNGGSRSSARVTAPVWRRLGQPAHRCHCSLVTALAGSGSDFIMFAQAAFVLTRLMCRWFLLQLEIGNANSSNFSVSEAKGVCGSSVWACVWRWCPCPRLPAGRQWCIRVWSHWLVWSCLEEGVARLVVFFFFIKCPINMFH